MMKNVETEYEEKLKLLNEKNHELEISLESKIQSNKICAQQDLSRSRHEWNKTRADYENKIEMMNLNLKSKDLELETSRKQIEELQLAQETLSDEVKRLVLDIFVICHAFSVVFIPKYKCKTRKAKCSK